MANHQAIFQNYLLYVRNGHQGSKEALQAASGVLEDTRVVDIDTLISESESIPDWLNGVPLCIHLGGNREVYRGTECISFFRSQSSQSSVPGGDKKVTEDDLQKFMEGRNSSQQVPI